MYSLCYVVTFINAKKFVRVNCTCENWAKILNHKINISKLG